VTQTYRQKWRQLQRETADRERYFRSSRLAGPNVVDLIAILSEVIEREVSSDENGLAAALRYIAAEEDGRVWRRSLRIIANALDNKNATTHLRLVRSKRGPRPVKDSKGATKNRRLECACFIFARIALRQQPKAVMIDAAAEFGVSKKTLYDWLESVADDHRKFRRTCDAIYDTPEERFENDIYRTDPFSLWLEKYESQVTESG
jgi:hypothetical protein